MRRARTLSSASVASAISNSMQRLMLVLASALWGLVAIRVFRSTTNGLALTRASKRIYARILEIRLYSADPGLVWRAQKALLAENLRFLALLASPVLILTSAFALLYKPLDVRLGARPLAAGETAVVTMPAPEIPLVALPGIVIETPPVRNSADGTVAWRIRATSPQNGVLTFRNGAHVIHPSHQDWLLWFFVISSVTAAFDAGFRKFRSAEKSKTK